MKNIQKIPSTLIDNSIRRGRFYDGLMDTVSRRIWRWHSIYLVVLIFFLACYTSTYVLLECSGNSNAYEGGIFASWALYSSGFTGLLLFDIISLSILVLMAIGIRFILLKYGFTGFGKLVFIVLLMPYAITATSAVINNIFLTLL